MGCLPVAAAALLLLLPLVPHAGAQQAPACASLRLSHVPVPAVAAGETVEVTVNLDNAGPAEVVATVAAVAQSSGWSVNPAESSLTVASGATQTARFTVRAPDDPSAPGTISFRATGQCSALGQPGPFAATEATDSVRIETARARGVAFPGLGEIPAAYTLGVVGIAAMGIGAALAMRRRRSPLQATCPEPLKDIRPGRGTSFPLEVSNPASSPDTALFQLGNVPPGWVAFLAVPELQLAAREARTLWLMLRAPPDAAADATCEVEVTVSSKAAPGSGQTLRVRAQVTAEPPAGAAPAEA